MRQDEYCVDRAVCQTCDSKSICNHATGLNIHDPDGHIVYYGRNHDDWITLAILTLLQDAYDLAGTRMERMMRKQEALKLQAAAHMDEKNDAELVEMIQANKGAPMKHLRADAYNRRRTVLSVNTPTLLEMDGNGFTKGDRVVMSEYGRSLNRMINARETGVVEGIVEGCVKVNGKLYHHVMWELVASTGA